MISSANFINHFKTLKILNINIINILKTAYCIKSCETYSDKLKRIYATITQQNLNIIKNVLLNQNQHILFMLKYNKKLQKYFDYFDLCVHILVKDIKRSVLNMSDLDDEEKILNSSEL